MSASKSQSAALMCWSDAIVVGAKCSTLWDSRMRRTTSLTPHHHLRRPGMDIINIRAGSIWCHHTRLWFAAIYIGASVVFQACFDLVLKVWSAFPAATPSALTHDASPAAPETLGSPHRLHDNRAPHFPQNCRPASLPLNTVLSLRQDISILKCELYISFGKL